ncbi:hypothetical protein D3C80_1369580 [compost metagenome]
MGLGKACTADGAGSGQVRDTDDGRHSAGDVGETELGGLVPFPITQVGAFARAAQRGDGMHATGDQAVDGLAQGRQVKVLAVAAERGDGVADDAVEFRGHETYSASKAKGRTISSGSRHAPAGTAAHSS